MRKIKVLRIIARLNIGGPAIHATLLTEGLDKIKFESFLACGYAAEEEGDMLYYTKEKNIRPVFIPELKREIGPLNDIIAFAKIYKVIKKELPDIIHTHTAKAGALGRSAGILYNFLHFFRGKQIKLVHTFHGHIFEGYFSRPLARLFVLIEKSLAFFTCKIITVSRSLKQELIDLGVAGKNKIIVMPLGLELDKFINIPPRDNNLALNIGIIGRLVPIKNHRLFLDSAAEVIKNNPEKPLKFKIVGDGESRKELEAYVQKLMISGSVDFLGWQKDLINVFLNLDIVALTSINEGTPVSLIEAMASGRAVVATDVGGVRDLLGAEIDTPVRPDADFKALERGVIVNPGDSSSFAAALNFMLQNNGLRNRMEEEARNFVKDKFTKDRLIKDMDDLYTGLSRK